MSDDKNNVHQLFPDTMEKIIVREINDARAINDHVAQQEGGGKLEFHAMLLAQNNRLCIALEAIAHCMARICDAVDEER